MNPATGKLQYTPHCAPCNWQAPFGHDDRRDGMACYKKPTVFVVEGHIEYEGFNIVAVCTTKEFADQAIIDYNKLNRPYDFYNISEHPIREV